MKVSLVKKGSKALALLFLCLTLSMTISGLALAKSLRKGPPPPGSISIASAARFISRSTINVVVKVNCTPSPDGNTGGEVEVKLSQDTANGDDAYFFVGLCDNRTHQEAIGVGPRAFQDFHLGKAAATAILFNANSVEIASASRVVNVVA